MVKDVKTGECFRADHLLEAALEATMEDPKASQQAKKVGMLRHKLIATLDLRFMCLSRPHMTFMLAGI